MGLELLYVVEGDTNLAKKANEVAAGDRGYLSAKLLAETKLDLVPNGVDPRLEA